MQSAKSALKNGSAASKNTDVAKKVMDSISPKAGLSGMSITGMLRAHSEATKKEDQAKRK